MYAFNNSYCSFRCLVTKKGGNALKAEAKCIENQPTGIYFYKIKIISTGVEKKVPRKRCYTSKLSYLWSRKLLSKKLKNVISKFSLMQNLMVLQKISHELRPNNDGNTLQLEPDN